MISPANSTPASPQQHRTPKDLQVIACIHRWLATFTAGFPGTTPPSVVEIRAIGCTEKYKPRPHTVGGFFDQDHLQQAAEAAFDLQFRNARGVYFTLNPVNPDLLARRANRVEAISDADSISATDSDILRRHWILIDADPVRTSGVSSSESEKEAARQTLQQVEDDLSLSDWPLPIKADSGNGHHLLYRVDLPNDEGSTALVRNCLRALAAKFDSDAVKIDTVVYNAARICKLYGTISRKGDHTPERPHRFSRVLQIPKQIEAVPLELLEELAATAPAEKATPKPSSNGKASRRSRLKGGRNGTPDPMKAAAAYLATIPPAISGQGGHKRLYHAASRLIDGFALSIDDALPLLLKWNETCQPPWSESELLRKLQEAEKNEGRSGSLLKELENKPLVLNSIRDLTMILPEGERAPFDVTPPDATDAATPATESLSILLVENRNDIANGKRLVRMFGDRIRYFHQWKSWLCFCGTHWQRDSTAEMHRMSKEISAQIWKEALYSTIPEDDAAEVLGFAKRTSQVVAIEGMLKSASSEPGIPIESPDLDSDNWKLNCPNGTLNLKTGELSPHNSADLITKITAAPYSPEIEVPTWEQFLFETFEGNVDIVDYLRRLLGYCLTGDVSEHILPVFYGTGSNGKSTLLNVIMEIVGRDYVMKAPPDFLMSKRQDAHPTERADLFGRRIVVANETSEGRRFDEALVKELTGGDPIRARRMREDFWEFQPTHKMILATNHRPVISGTDHGIWRRMRLIPFNAKITGDKVDKTLPEKLRAEYPGILAWMVRGCLEWQNGGLRDPNEVLEATNEYRQSQDIIQSYFQERCIILDGCKVRARDLYEDYSKWCGDSGEHAISVRRFGTMMTERGFDRYSNNGTWYSGIMLLTDRSTDNDGFRDEADASQIEF